MGEDVMDGSRVCPLPPGPSEDLNRHLRPRTILMAVSLSFILTAPILISFMMQSPIPPSLPPSLPPLLPPSITRVSGIPHGPIVIDGDADFSATALLEGWPGDGSPESPFIIDGLDIDLDGNSGSCINISNTGVNFIIRNCSLTGASATERGSGIFLENVIHGELVKNILDGNRFGIWVQRSNYSTVSDNTFTNNVIDGIDFISSSHNTVVNNTFFDNSDSGIHLRFSSTSNTLINNTCYNNSIGIYLNNSHSNTVANNTCTSNNGGINLFVSDSNTISNNTCCGSKEYGINLHDSDSNTVVNNTCNYNGIGIILENSYFNTVTDNTCNDNNEREILEVYENEVSEPEVMILLLVVEGVILLFGFRFVTKLSRVESNEG